MNKFVKGLILGTLLTGLAACSGGGSGAGGGSSTTNDLVLSGSLGATSIMSKATAAGDVGKFGTYDDLKFYVTVYTEPPQIKSVDLGSDGSFSLTFAGASGNFIEASFKSKSTGIVQAVKFVDPTKSSLSSTAGSGAEYDTYALKGQVNFGTLNIVDGKATIDVTTVIPAANKDEAAPTIEGYDFSGAWTAAPYTVPQALKDEGFVTAESGFDPNNPTNNMPAGGWSCGNEPCVPAGMAISFVKITGKEFTKGASCTDDNTCDATTGGTVGTTNKYGISIWEGPVSGTGSGLAACSTKTGFSASSARYGAGIHVTSAKAGATDVTVADFTFGTLNGGAEGTGEALPWMATGATSDYGVYDCYPMEKNSIKLYVCKGKATVTNPNDTTVYWANEQSSTSGCTEDNTGKPVRVTDWNITPADNTCWNGTPVAGFNGFTRTSCQYVNVDPDGAGGPATATTFTCKHGGGTYLDSTLATPATNITGGGGPDAIIAQNDPCDINYADGADSTEVKARKKLAAYQCYAQGYRDAAKAASGCFKEYKFNWGATTAEQFVMNDNRGRPRQNFITDLLTYSADGNTLFVNSAQKETVGIKNGADGGMEFCNIEVSTKIVGKKMSDTQQLFTLVEQGILLDSQKTACVAAVNGADTWENGNLSYRVGKGNRMMFLLNK